MKETVFALLIVWHSDPFVYQGYIEPPQEMVLCDESPAAAEVCARYAFRSQDPTQ